MSILDRERLVEALVMRAILQGSVSPDQLLAVLSPLSGDEVIEAVQRLLAEGKIEARAGRFVVTEKGLEHVSSVAAELEGIQAENGKGLPDELRDLEPLLYTLGFMSLAPEESGEEYLLAPSE